MPDETLTPQTSFWLVVILSLPTFAAFLIVVSATLHPNMSVYLLIPLAFVAPFCLLGAVIFAIQARHSMPRQLFRGACIVLSLALVVGMAAVIIVKTS
jgi:hypothetical protein